jgi:hypothetical protein
VGDTNDANSAGPGASLGVMILPRKRQSRGTPFMTFNVGPVVATKEERTSDARSTALIASLYKQEMCRYSTSRLESRYEWGNMNIIYLIFSRDRFCMTQMSDGVKAYLERDMVVSGVRAIEKNG